jgi:hypothetical protein
LRRDDWFFDFSKNELCFQGQPSYPKMSGFSPEQQRQRYYEFRRQVVSGPRGWSKLQVKRSDVIKLFPLQSPVREKAKKSAYRVEQIATELARLPVLPDVVTKTMRGDYNAAHQTVKKALMLAKEMRALKNVE